MSSTIVAIFLYVYLKHPKFRRINANNKSTSEETSPYYQGQDKVSGLAASCQQPQKPNQPTATQGP
jgi:hypothetical protein